MAQKEVYRDADYDIDPFIEDTASWPDGLHEAYRFLPHFETKMRRTSSADDISRHYRYFQLAQSNQGNWFTWRHYLRILRDDLRHFDTFTLMSKMLINSTCTPINSEISNYITASDSDSSKKKTPTNSRWSKRSFLRKEVVLGDAESISSLDSNISITPKKNFKLLKKVYTEIRSLGRKTCKNVEKLSINPKYCSSCGEYMGSSKLHKKCSRSFRQGTPYCKLPTTGARNVPNVVKTRSKTLMSPVKGGGECVDSDPQCSKTASYSPYMECKTSKYYAKQQG